MGRQRSVSMSRREFACRLPPPPWANFASRTVADVIDQRSLNDMNRHEVREKEFALKRDWARKQASDKLREGLKAGTLRGGFATAAREVLVERGD